MPLQTVSAQSGEATKGSVDLQTATVQVAQKAIPAAAPIELISHGKAEHGWLGVSVQELTPELAKSLDMDIPKGALIANVVENGPADKAGMQRGDVVIAYQNKEIPDGSTLRNAVATSPIGQEVRVTVLRRGRKQLVTVKIGNLQDSTKMLAISLRDRLGADVRLVTAGEAEKYNLSSQQGVAIVWLDRIGPLGEVGFEVGDIILEVNGKAIESFENFVDSVSSLNPHQRMTFLGLDHRSGRTGYVQVKAR